MRGPDGRPRWCAAVGGDVLAPAISSGGRTDDVLTAYALD
jgi:hypothetical protein